jgi:predicted 2-oxoglutarate/Fe(II)-dependent dioxygenase YbiX
MLAVNYNITTKFHIDLSDEGMCVIVPVGEWEGGELIIPQLGIKINLVKGQVVMMRSSLLVHGNYIARGFRIGLVFFSHKQTFPL